MKIKVQSIRGYYYMQDLSVFEEVLKIKKLTSIAAYLQTYFFHQVKQTLLWPFVISQSE